MKRVVAVAVLMSMVPAVSLVPAAGALLLVRPAVAAPEAAVVPVYDQVGLTALLSGVRTDGTVGASGGLVTLDTGSAYLAARLDAAPSSQVLAAPYQPGALARTVVGQVNGGAGSAVLEVPEADSSVYLKAMDRKRWAFALVGVAAARVGAETRIALAGAAPVPWLLDSPNALDAATPLPGTAYKVEIARALIPRALASL